MLQSVVTCHDRRTPCWPKLAAYGSLWTVWQQRYSGRPLDESASQLPLQTQFLQDVNGADAVAAREVMVHLNHSPNNPNPALVGDPMNTRTHTAWGLLAPYGAIGPTHDSHLCVLLASFWANAIVSRSRLRANAHFGLCVLLASSWDQRIGGFARVLSCRHTLCRCTPCPRALVLFSFRPKMQNATTQLHTRFIRPM